MKRLLTAVLALTLALTGIAVLPESAAAASKPRISFTTVKRDFATKCGTFKLSHRKPVLTGGDKEIAKKVGKIFEATYREWIGPAKQHFDYNAELDGSCAGKPHFKIDTTGSIYQGRYLSLAYTWTGDWLSASLDGVRTFTVDLKTGESVKLSKFISNKGKVFTWTACNALAARERKTAPGFAGEISRIYCHWGENQPLDGWTVSKSGVQVYGSHDAGLFKATLPWAKLVKPSYTKSKKTTTKKVPTKACLGNPKATVTVQGNLVTVRHDGYSITAYGIKSGGRKVGTKWRVTVEYSDGGAADWWGPGYVDFASKSSNTARKVSC